MSPATARTQERGDASPMPSLSAILLRGLQTGGTCAWAGVRLVVLFTASPRARRDWRRVAGQRAAVVMERLGPCFIKIGQILSARPDLLHPELADPLSALQDHVAPAQASEIQRLIEAAFARPLSGIFKSFDPVPVASASIAQVHRAITHDGQCIALKIKRPGVDRHIALDLAALRWIARIASVMPGSQLLPIRELVEELAVPLETQLDFRREAASQSRFRSNLRGQELIQIPAVYEEFCTDSTIGMEFVESGGEASEPDRKRSVVAGLRALYRMIFFDGFVHADLHPGNLVFKKNGGLVLLDMGLVSELSPSDRNDFTDFFFGLVNREGDTCASILISQAAYLGPRFDEAKFRKDIDKLIARHSALKSREFNIAAFVGEMIGIQRGHGMRGSVKFIMTVLAMAVFDGICKQHFPDCDFQAEARPYLILSRFGRTTSLKIRP